LKKQSKRRRRPGNARIKVSPKIDRTTDGIVFDSKMEMHRYLLLKRLQNLGRILHLELQPEFPIAVETETKECLPRRPESKSEKLMFVYRGDFRYLRVDTQQVVVEDVKGHRTEIYRMKKKFVEAVHGIEIEEITKPKQW